MLLAAGVFDEEWGWRCACDRIVGDHGSGPLCLPGTIENAWGRSWRSGMSHSNRPVARLYPSGHRRSSRGGIRHHIGGGIGSNEGGMRKTFECQAPLGAERVVSRCGDQFERRAVRNDQHDSVEFSLDGPAGVSKGRQKKYRQKEAPSEEPAAGQPAGRQPRRDCGQRQNVRGKFSYSKCHRTTGFSYRRPGSKSPVTRSTQFGTAMSPQLQRAT